MSLAIAAIIGGLFLLVFGADRFVTGAAQTARGMGISPLIIGMTIVGMATSAPEVLVGSVAALQGKTNIAIGNAIGSNIANIGLVLGGTALFLPLEAASKTLRREYLAMLASILLALLFSLDCRLSRLDGMLLIFALILITWWIIKLARSAPRKDPLAGEFGQELKVVLPIWKSLTLLVLGLVLLLAGSELLIEGAVFLAKKYGVSDLVIGLTIIAVGTSLPEFAASIMSAIKNEADIAIGNVIGSNMFNMLMVMGVPSIIYPGEFGRVVLVRDFPVMILLTLLMGRKIFISNHGKFTRIEGAILLTGFISYQCWIFYSITQP